MPYDNANKVVNELFETFLSRYQTFLETSMRGSDFIFRFSSTVVFQMSQDKF